MPFASKCSLLVPFVNVPRDRQHHENHKELQRWADRLVREPDCLGADDKFALKVPHPYPRTNLQHFNNYKEIQRWSDRLLAEYGPTRDDPFPTKCALNIPFPNATQAFQHGQNWLEIQRWADRLLREDEGCLPVADPIPNVCGRNYDGTFTVDSPDNLDLSLCEVRPGDFMLVALEQTSVTSGACGGPDPLHDVPAATRIFTRNIRNAALAGCRSHRASLYWMIAPSDINTNGLDFTHTDPVGSGSGGQARIDVISFTGLTTLADWTNVGFAVQSKNIGPLTGGNYIVLQSTSAVNGAWGIPSITGLTAHYSGTGLAVYPSDGSQETTDSNDSPFTASMVALT